MNSAGFLLFVATLTLLQSANCDIANDKVETVDEKELIDQIYDGLIVLKSALTNYKFQLDPAWKEKICKLLHALEHVCGHKDLDTVHNEPMEELASTKEVFDQGTKSEIDDQDTYKATIYDTITNLETVLVQNTRNAALKSRLWHELCELLQLLNGFCKSV